MKAAPLALFVYNRPLHTEKVLEALKKNNLATESDLYIFADGPQKEASAEVLQQIKKVRDILKNVDGFKSVSIIESEFNKGLSHSITSGIDHVFEKHEQVIVFEDDIVAHNSFLTFCNLSLDRYKNDERVFAISGYSFPVKKKLPPVYFLNAGAVWGWACWKRSWKHFSLDAERLLEEIKVTNRVSEFNFGNKYNYFEMLEQHKDAKISSWDVCWYASIFLRQGFTLYPSKSLTINIGMDGSGTHYSGKQSADNNSTGFSISAEDVKSILNYIPANVGVDLVARSAIGGILSNQLKGRVVDRIRNVFKKTGLATI